VRHHKHRRTAPRAPFSSIPERPARAQYKTRQLCRQAYCALTSALSGEVGDPLLQSLTVVDVTPAPDATRLLVDLAPGACSTEAPPLHEVLARLDAVHGLLRHAVATAIVRKRAPELVFRYAPQGGDAHAC
jgi:ribosome-binding factor A